MQSRVLLFIWILNALIINTGMIFKNFIFQRKFFNNRNFFICEWIIICKVSFRFSIILLCLIYAFILINNWSSRVFDRFYKFKFLLIGHDYWSLTNLLFFFSHSSFIIILLNWKLTDSKQIILFIWFLFNLRWTNFVFYFEYFLKLFTRLNMYLPF